MVVDVGSLMAGNRSLIGVFLGAEIMSDRAHDMIQGLIEEAARGELKGVVDREFPLSEAAATHAYIESRRAVGTRAAHSLTCLGLASGLDECSLFVLVRVMSSTFSCGP
jgi:hypothetical protein